MGFYIQKTVFFLRMVRYWCVMFVFVNETKESSSESGMSSEQARDEARVKNVTALKNVNARAVMAVPKTAKM